MTSPAPQNSKRDEQIAETLALCAVLRSQGWGKVTIAITRGGTYRVEAEQGEGSAVRTPLRAR